jgi:hypothetical protein
MDFRFLEIFVFATPSEFGFVGLMDFLDCHLTKSTNPLICHGVTFRNPNSDGVAKTIFAV